MEFNWIFPNSLQLTNLSRSNKLLQMFFNFGSNPISKMLKKGDFGEFPRLKHLEKKGLTCHDMSELFLSFSLIKDKQIPYLLSANCSVLSGFWSIFGQKEAYLASFIPILLRFGLKNTQNACKMGISGLFRAYLGQIRAFLGNIPNLHFSWNSWQMGK